MRHGVRSEHVHELRSSHDGVYERGMVRERDASHYEAVHLVNDGRASALTDHTVAHFERAEERHEPFRTVECGGSNLIALKGRGKGVGAEELLHLFVQSVLLFLRLHAVCFWSPYLEWRWHTGFVIGVHND